MSVADVIIINGMDMTDMQKEWIYSVLPRTWPHGLGTEVRGRQIGVTESSAGDRSHCGL